MDLPASPCLRGSCLLGLASQDAVDPRGDVVDHPRAVHLVVGFVAEAFVAANGDVAGEGLGEAEDGGLVDDGVGCGDDEEERARETAGA